MDRELLDNERISERDDKFKPKDDQALCKEPKEGKEEETLVNVLLTTVEHYFPRFNEWLSELTDGRDQNAILYDKRTIVWTALITMITKRGSRNKINEQLRNNNCKENLSRLSGQDDLRRVPHGDTVEYFNLRAKEEEFEELQAKMMGMLLRGRVLERPRLLGKYYSLAIDGNHLHTFDYAHCEHCLVRTKNGKKQWFHYKLQASLVTPEGLCLAMCSEWIENEREYDKQDCELRAFYRLAKKVRRLYPRLRICLLLDGLYGVQPVFDILKKYRMEWIIVFKEGRMSEVYNWIKLMRSKPGMDNILVRKEARVVGVRNRRTHQEKFIRGKVKRQTRVIERERVYGWMNQIKHWDEKRAFNVMRVKEVEDGKTNCEYVWLVSDELCLCKETIEELAERGRCRWKIENEGFNTQKNGGYKSEHCYSRDPVAMKVWNLIIDIAHLINQLIERGSLIKKKVYGSISNISQRMFEHFRYSIFKKPKEKPRIQIRLCWDTS